MGDWRGWWRVGTGWLVHGAGVSFVSEGDGDPSPGGNVGPRGAGGVAPGMLGGFSWNVQA